MDKCILKFNKVKFFYHTPKFELLALDDISFDIQEGEFISIVGPSGCGKTTILSLISGLLKPSSGEIVLPQNNRRGYMFQKDHLFEWRTIEQNVMLGLEIQKKLKDSIQKEYVYSLLKKYGLDDFKKSKPSELSGGMRQRVALIRTLALNPDILLLDEPFSALDFQTRLKVCDDVYDIITKEKKTSILVTHDISEAVSVSDRVIILSARPAKIKKIITLDLKKYGSPFQRRGTQEFRQYFDEIWKELSDEETKNTKLLSGA